MNTHIHRAVRSVALTGVALSALNCLHPNIAAAQAQDAALDTETIFITARNRAESLQDVPLAVTAFDAEAIRRKNLQELNDIARFTAGFSFEDFDGGNANPAIRGQSTLRVTGREQTVGTFVDGIYMPRSWVVNLGLQGFERLEVVKGPQSARYGRNAFAGAINYVSARPGDDIAVAANATVGNWDRYDVGASLSIPVVQDVLAVRFGFDHTQFDGSWENTHPNADLDFSPGTTGRIGGWDNQTFRAIAVLTPTEYITIEASYIHFDKSEEGRAARWLNTGQGQGTCGGLEAGGTFGLFCGEFPVTGETAVLDPRGFGRQANIDVGRISLEVEFSEAITATYQFGLLDAQSITANTAESDPVNCGTILGPPVFPTLCNFQGAPIGDLDYQQHEVRITFDNGGPLRAAAGAFYMNGDDRPSSVSINLPPLGTESIDIDPVNSTSFPDFSNFIFNRELTNTESYSFFAEATFTFNDGRTRFGAEGRYTSERIETTNLRLDPPAAVQGSPETFKFFTPRITIEHDLTDDTLLYATVARGAKAGGFNAAAISPELAVFDPEFNWTYEVGAKNTFLDGTATLNVAAFYTDWSNLQISLSDPLGTVFTSGLTSNLGDARIFGFEAEGSWQATDRISFDTAISYTNARYKDGTVDATFSAGPFPPCTETTTVCDVVIGENGLPLGADISGNTLERSPTWQLALGGQWEDEITADLAYYVRADISYQSEHFAESINVATAPGRTLVNARLGFDYKENFRIAVWARNLFDERYVSNSLQIIQPLGSNILGTYFGERRTFGVSANFSY
ncbi:MAG: TonB-dependent receptor [Pseudomonadota bacterium]